MNWFLMFQKQRLNRLAQWSLMSQAAELAIPLLVEAGVGDNWDEAH